MKKRMFPLPILLTALLLISFAFLPALAGILQDTGVEKTVSNRPLHSIEPHISANGSGLHFPDKLAILQKCEVSSIVSAMATMTETQVRTAVENGIQQYLETDIIHPFQSWELQAMPYVAISGQDSQRWFLFWYVILSETSDDIQHSLSVRVDDETGAFLTVEYTGPYASVDWTLMDQTSPPLNQFTKIWLEQAGLWYQPLQISSGNESYPLQGSQPGSWITAYEVYEGVEKPLYIRFSLSDYGDPAIWMENMPPVMQH